MYQSVIVLSVNATRLADVLFHALYNSFTPPSLTRSSCHIGTQDDSREVTTSGLQDGSSSDMYRLEYFYLITYE